MDKKIKKDYMMRVRMNDEDVKNLNKISKAHNDKLHKEQAKEKAKKNARAEKLKEIQRKFNESKS